MLWYCCSSGSKRCGLLFIPPNSQRSFAIHRVRLWQSSSSFFSSQVGGIQIVISYGCPSVFVQDRGCCSLREVFSYCWHCLKDLEPTSCSRCEVMPQGHCRVFHSRPVSWNSDLGVTSQLSVQLLNVTCVLRGEVCFGIFFSSCFLLSKLFLKRHHHLEKPESFHLAGAS